MRSNQISEVGTLKNSRAMIENRRKRILMELQKNGTVNVQAISEELNASPLTIRRDLAYLEEQGTVHRHYGGATICAGIERKEFHTDDLLSCREAIAMRAAEFVEDGDTIFINSSSSALIMLQFVTANDVTVITNNGKILGMDIPMSMTVVLTGGELRIPKASMIGNFAVNNLSRVTATKAFFGCSGLTADEGFTTASMQEVAVNQTMLSRVTGECFILADHTKVGKKNSFISGTLDQLDCVITDNKADREVLESIEVKNVRVIQVNPMK